MITKIRPSLALLCLVCFSAPGLGQTVEENQESESSSLQRALDQAGSNRAELQLAIDQSSREQRKAMLFLIRHMPVKDLTSLSSTFLLENVRLAFAAKEAAPWGQQIPEEIFLNDVLPYANVSETREAWRSEFHKRFAPAIKECTTAGEAALKLNQTIFAELGVRYSTRRRRADQSPSESIQSGLASCTGLSILLVNACRAVGVPARLAGTPMWVNKRGNHTWVEVWDGQWHFVGAAEPSEKGLNHAWFQGIAGQALKDHPRHAIYAVSFSRTEDRFPMVWNRSNHVYAVNVTDRYTRDTLPTDGKVKLLVRVWNKGRSQRRSTEVKLTCLECRTEPLRGISRSDRADMNDILSFDVVPGHRIRVSLSSGGKKMERTVVVKPDAEQLLDFEID